MRVGVAMIDCQTVRLVLVTFLILELFVLGLGFIFVSGRNIGDDI